jgi:hypothetical protein
VLLGSASPAENRRGKQDSNRSPLPCPAQFAQIFGFRDSMSSICSMSYTAKGTNKVQ